MAEEINTTESTSDVASALPQLEGTQQEIPTVDLSKFTIPAKPLSIDAYKNSVGNPITGSNPAAKASAPGYADSLFEAADLKMQTASDPYKEMRPFTYNGDYDGANFERYYSAKDTFDKLGFSPYRDNEALYNNKMTLGDQFSRAASQWDNLALTGFKSGIKAWGTLFTDPLAPDLESAREMERAMAIGNVTTGGFGGFAANTFLNSAYTIGIAADFLAEEVALAGITAFTGGLAGEVTVPGMAAKAGLAARKMMGYGAVAQKALKGIDKASDLAKGAENIRQASRGFDKIKNISSARDFFHKAMSGAGDEIIDILNPLDNTLAAFKKTDYATDLAKTIGRAGSFIEDAIQIKTAVSEAKLEGGMVKINATKQLIDAYREKNGGRDPEGQDLQNIETLASEEARRTALWNLPAIITSNKLLYSTMMLPIAKMMGRTSSKLIEDIAVEGAGKGLARAKSPFKVTGSDVGSQIKAAGKSLISPKYYGKFGMNYLKANFAEGIQENIQEAISQGAIEHALAVQSDPKMAAYQGYNSYFLHGMKSQLSEQGAETFASGFLMGMFVQPIMTVPSWSIGKISELSKGKEAREAAKAERDKALGLQASTLNELADNDIEYWAPDIVNAVKNGGLSDDLFTAAQEGNHKGAADAKEGIQFNQFITALESGKFDILMDKLRDYKNLTPEEAADAFKKYGIQAKDVPAALAQIDGVIERAEQTRDTYEAAVQEFPNPYEYTKYKKGTEIYNQMAAANFGWKQAVYNLAMAGSTFQSYTDRIQKMSNTFASISDNIAKADAQSLMSVLSTTALDQELSTLKKEIRTLTEPEQSKLRTRKEKNLELLSNFKESIEAAQEEIVANKVTSFKGKQALYGQAKADFAKYLAVLAKRNDTILFDKDVNKAFSILTDSLEMRGEMRNLAKSINILSSPAGFLKLQQRVMKAVIANRPFRQQQILDNLALFTKLNDENKILNAIAERGSKVPPEFLEEYKKAEAADQPIPTPTYFINSETDERITAEDGDKFDDAINLWAAFVDWREKHRISKIVTDVKDAVKGDDIKDFDPDDYSTFSNIPELKKQIDELFASVNKSEELTIEDFIKTNMRAKGIIAEAAKISKILQESEQKKAEAAATADPYKDVTTDELNKKAAKISKDLASMEDEKTEEYKKLFEERAVIQNVLTNRARQDVKINADQKVALAKLDAIGKTTKNKDDEGQYIIDNDKKDTRVTKVADKALQDLHNVPEFDLTREGEMLEPLLEAYKEVEADTKLQSPDPKKYAANLMKAWKEKVGDLAVMKSRFNERKLKDIEKALVGPKDAESFKALLNKAAYDEAGIRGTTVDVMGRDFFAGKLLKRENYNMTESAFNEARKAFFKFSETIAERNELIISNGLILWGETEIEVDGKKQTVGGEMDLLVITPEGKFKIYDMKTATSWNKFGTPKDRFYKKDRYSLQLSFYKNLLENLTGIKVDELELVGFETTEDLNGKVLTVKPAKSATDLVINYDTDTINKGTEEAPDLITIKDVASQYIPSQLEEKKPDEKSKDLSKENDTPNSFYLGDVSYSRNTDDNHKTYYYVAAPLKSKLPWDKLRKDFEITEKKYNEGYLKSLQENEAEKLKAEEKERAKALAKKNDELYWGNNTNNIAGKTFPFNVGEDETGNPYNQGIRIEKVHLLEDGNYRLAATNRVNGNTYDMITEPNGNVVSYTRNGKTYKGDTRDEVVFGVGDYVNPLTEEPVDDQLENIALIKAELKVAEDTLKTTKDPKMIKALNEAVVEIKAKLAAAEEGTGEPVKEGTVADELKAFAPVDVDAFNDMSIKDKWQALHDELSAGKELTGIITNDYPTDKSDYSWQIKFPDGRTVRTTIPKGNKVVNETVKLVATSFLKGKVQEPAIQVVHATTNKDLTWVRKTQAAEKVNNPVKETQDLSVEVINKDVNAATLRAAKQSGFDAEYKSIRYAIIAFGSANLNVILSDASGKQIVVKEDEYKNITIIDPKGPTATGEEIDIVRDNSKMVKDAPIVLDETKTKAQRIEDLKNKIC
jgi:hypothetical protein